MNKPWSDPEEFSHHIREIAASYKDFNDLLEESASYVSKPPANATLLASRVIELGEGDRYVFIGDLHGDYYTILGILDKGWDLIKNSEIIFLGDYIDRGLLQVETLTLVLWLKKELRDQVILLRGNHEPPRWLIPHPHDYVDLLKKRFGDAAEQLYENSLELFETLPLAVFKRDHFIALHGGPPLRALSSDSIDSAFSPIKLINDEPDEVLVDVLWSDPGEIPVDYLPSPRGAGHIYGASVTSSLLRLINGKLLIRGHEAVNGFKSNHNGLVITVFTSPLVYGFRCGGFLIYEVRESGGYKATRACYEPRTKRILILNNSYFQ